LVLATSLFDRFSFELIENLFRDSEHTALKGEHFDTSVQKILDLDSPFLIALDDTKVFHRIHHLIREILKERAFDAFSTRQIEEFYKRAATFFAQRGFYEEAIKYSILGKDEQKAVEIIVSKWEELMDYGENLLLKRWIGMLPPGLSQADPALLVIKAYLCDTSADFKYMAKYLKQASNVIDRKRSSPRLLGSFASVHSALSCYTNNLPEALEYANLALDTLSHDQHFLLDYAQNFKVIALNSMESYEAAKNFLIESRSKLNEGEKLRLMRSHVIQMFIDWYGAKLEDLKFSGGIVVDICKEEKVWWFYRVGFYYLGQFHYMKNDVEKVYDYIDQGIDCAFNSSPIWAFHLYYTGIFAALARNDVTKAQAYVQSVRDLVRINDIPEYEAYILAFEVEMALRTNEIKRAWELNQKASYDIHPPVYYYYVPQFTRIKLYMRMDDEFLLKQAGEQIQQIKESIKENKVHHALIQVTLLEAIWHHHCKDDTSALNSLREAITLVHEPDYIRVFLDFGQTMQQLLELLPKEEKKNPLVSNILNAFRYESFNRDPILSDSLLTKKEMNIMDLVDKGLFNKEIAEQLCLSESTIKTYLYRIYQKLDVNNRVSALQRLKKIRTS
jgi:LuxR family maltose regulon positive regulatory protein